MAETDRLIRVVLENETLSRLLPWQKIDRIQAVTDLEASNHFSLLSLPTMADHQPNQPLSSLSGPYVLYLSIHTGRLVFRIHDANDEPLTAILLALGPFRRLIKDYQILVESHTMAMEDGRDARIKAIDMGRRGLHNEAATLLQKRLEGKIRLDFETARRLFSFGLRIASSSRTLDMSHELIRDKIVNYSC